MQYTRLDLKIVYCSDRCRKIFYQPANSSRRKGKTIKAVVTQYKLRVYPYSQDDLVQILKQLLNKGVFESTSRARSVFPELFPPPIQQIQETQQTPAPTSDIYNSVMEEIKETFET